MPQQRILHAYHDRHYGRVLQHASLVSVDDTGRHRELWRFAWIFNSDDASSRVRFSRPPIWVGGAAADYQDSMALVGVNTPFIICERASYGKCPFNFGPRVVVHPRAANASYAVYTYRVTMETACGSRVSVAINMFTMMLALSDLRDKIAEKAAV